MQDIDNEDNWKIAEMMAPQGNNMIRILITGSSGMLGATLVKMWSDIYDIYATDISSFREQPAKKFMSFDLLSNSYSELIKWSEPDIIVHCAAIINLEFCEKNPDIAFSVNSESVRRLIQSSKNSKIIFISSDAVYHDGIFMAKESDKIFPENIYGKSKVLGEKCLFEDTNNHCCIRTTIIGKNINPDRKGFIEWIIDSVKKGKNIKLFQDANFTPITIWHLAKEMQFIIDNNIKGTYNISGREKISKYEFGLRLCSSLNLDVGDISKGYLMDHKSIVKRSRDQTLDSTLYASKYNRNLPTISELIHLLKEQYIG